MFGWPAEKDIGPSEVRFWAFQAERSGYYPMGSRNGSTRKIRSNIVKPGLGNIIVVAYLHSLNLI